MAKLPDGTDWMVDGKASNCKAPADVKHYCWQRVGDPRNPRNPAQPLDVLSNSGVCKVGAGSIGTPKYHGFLTQGHIHTSRLRELPTENRGL